jgi:two-component system, response regulator RegA
VSAPGFPTDARVLVVDDDDRLRDRLVRALQGRGYGAAGAPGGAEALELLSTLRPTHAIVDLRMPQTNGLELIAALREREAELKIVMLTGYSSIATAVDAVRLGAVNYLSKPADVDMILAAFVRGDEAPLTDTAEYEPPSLARAEWEHINRVLDDCGGNISKAARLLGLHRRSLQRKLQKYPPRK